MEQIFFEESRCRFNLRNPKGSKPTPIYLVTSIKGKQYKVTTSVKVYPSQWNQSLQVAVVSNINTKQSNKNNRFVNERLNKIRGYYSDFIYYLCDQEETPANIGEVLKRFIYRDMKRTIDVVDTITSAFDYYYTNISTVKESTRTTQRTRLNWFIKYIQEKQLNKVSVFSQSGLNAYKAYLIEKMNTDESIGKERINTCCQLIERLINYVLCVNDEYLKYSFSSVKYVKIKDSRQQDDIPRKPLYKEEIQSIKDCATLTKAENRYRILFLLQCAIGVRVSDLRKILEKDYEEKDGIILVQTIKSGIYAYIYITDEIIEYLNEIDRLNIKSCDESGYNKVIKTICKKAGLNRVIDWKDSRGDDQSNQLWEIVSSHWARHTFITNKVKECVPYEVLCKMTGHTDDEMIKRVYANLTNEEKADKVRDYYNNQSETTKCKDNKREQSVEIVSNGNKTIKLIGIKKDVSNEPVEYKDIKERKQFVLDKIRNGEFLTKEDVRIVYKLRNDGVLELDKNSTPMHPKFIIVKDV